MDNEKMKKDLGPSAVFPIGEKNAAFAKYFTGQSYLSMLIMEGVPIGNVTFEPGCRNWWHIHHKGGQILMSVLIKSEVSHWHGAAPDSWFSHLAVEIPADGASNEWLRPVTDEEYSKVK